MFSQLSVFAQRARTTTASKYIKLFESKTDVEHYRTILFTTLRCFKYVRRKQKYNSTDWRDYARNFSHNIDKFNKIATRLLVPSIL